MKIIFMKIQRKEQMKERGKQTYKYVCQITDIDPLLAEGFKSFGNKNRFRRILNDISEIEHSDIVELLPQPMEKEDYFEFPFDINVSHFQLPRVYISFTKYCEETNVKFRFVDSYSFMGFSLDALSSILIEEDFVNLRNEFHDLEDTKCKLLLRKGVFCYDYVDNMNKLQEIQLPRQEDFYSILTDEGISLEDYEHAQNVWRTFCCRNLGEYADLYLKTDVMLLTDIFEQFRATCHETYGLDPAHYYTLPGYTWDAMLKHTKCSLETIQDVDILLFFESGVRGGLSQCSNRYSIANNKYVPGYNSEAPSKYLMYFDVNNLYGWAMSQYLPFGGFEWLTDLEDFNIIQTSVIF
ncbi:hypothetical protein NQ315_014710 [Exocentrus adspersus]|uniref:DNA-directed DNA polymerase n=1 Tax=Exocentrus adspersus TaxID=1586481 RepID=A0AAV8VDY1_9CUCU|nr:hypothetical protein NQ315_014710 [Exocentrus adspersus]